MAGASYVFAGAQPADRPPLLPPHAQSSSCRLLSAQRRSRQGLLVHGSARPGHRRALPHSPLKIGARAHPGMLRGKLAGLIRLAVTSAGLPVLPGAGASPIPAQGRPQVVLRVAAARVRRSNPRSRARRPGGRAVSLDVRRPRRSPRWSTGWLRSAPRSRAKFPALSDSSPHRSSPRWGRRSTRYCPATCAEPPRPLRSSARRSPS